MKISKKIKMALKLLLFLLVVALIFGLIPRVDYHKSAYGYELAKSDVLTKEIQEELNSYVKDTASRMQIVIAIENDQIIYEYGATDKLINCHSARKSIMSLLIGIAVDKGYLTVDETLEQLRIDERELPLTKQEKSATVRDLLMNRSGIYLPAEGEHAYQGNNRPKRGKYQPGEFFFYNNFDFNVLGTILEKRTGKTIGEFIEKYLAIPIGMQDFDPDNIIYGNPFFIRKDNSDHRIFWMFLSARDLARIGALITQNGRWKNNQIVSENWLKQSLENYPLLSNKKMEFYYPYKAFSYSWWIEKENNTIWADGFGGQFLCIDKKRKLVIAQRNFTGNSFISSGLFLMDKDRDNNPKSDLIHVYEKIRKHLEI